MTDETTGEDKGLAELRQKVFPVLAQQALKFFESDVSTMVSIQQIFDTIAGALKEKQSELFKDFPSTRIDIDALRAAFEVRTKDSSPGDMAGSEIDLSWLTDLGGFISEVGDFIKYEKKTFLAILLLIFCKDCECVCKFINQPECCDDVAGQ